MHTARTIRHWKCLRLRSIPTLLVGVLAFMGCSEGSQPRTEPPNVILISVDTLRADHLSLYGYSRATSPHIDEFARTASVYSRAHTTAPWTLSAHASLFTGLYPAEHGAQMIRRRKGAKPNMKFPLRADAQTLAEVLEELGYSTAAICGNLMYLVPRYGLNQGFRHFETLKGGGKLDPARGSEINQSAFGWLAKHTSVPDYAPFFLFLNYMDTHTPYNTTPRPGFLEQTKPYSEQQRKLNEAKVNSRYAPVPASVLTETIDQYDLSIANLDESLGELFAELEAMDLFDDALIIVLSDHGEYLGEHELLGHAKDVYQGAMHVPLIIKAPMQEESKRETDLISLVHLPFMIMQALGLEEQVADDLFPYRWPDEQIHGKMRFSLWVDVAMPWGKRFNRIREALYHGQQKFIHSSDGQHELYDLKSDPAEVDNLLVDSPALVAHWTELIAEVKPKYRKSRPGLEPETIEHVPGDLSEEERAKLRALGYIE
jgi:arylsulfatase A-like enzyme